MKTYTEYLRESAVPRDVIDRFLDPAQISWARFDPEVGYVLSNSMPRDGVNCSSSISTVGPNGARTSFMYSDRPRRINTYGNSFTQCHQVCDGETWQEYLAAHFGEPIGNFGMGGFGVYQAFRRMLRTEDTEDGADNIILYIWGDDHFRSCLRSRYPITRKWIDPRGNIMFHGNFWANIEMDLDTGELVERDSILTTPESLYKMCDPDFMIEALGDDLMVQLYLMSIDSSVWEDLTDYSFDKLKRLAEILGTRPIGSEDIGSCRDEIADLKNAYGFASTRYILDRSAQYARNKGKRLMIALFSPAVASELIETGKRQDQPVVDYLVEQSFSYFDMNLVHLKDFEAFKLTVDEYWKRYAIGHYSPAGNHFFAHSFAKVLVEWLDPKPVTYRNDQDEIIDFEGYLPRS